MSAFDFGDAVWVSDGVCCSACFFRTRHGCGPDCEKLHPEGNGHYIRPPAPPADKTTDRPAAQTISQPESNSKSAGSIAPSNKKLIVSHAHDHKTLKEGDIVIMVCDPKWNNWLFRVSDSSLHGLQDFHEQYVHLSEKADAMIEARKEGAA